MNLVYGTGTKKQRKTQTMRTEMPHCMGNIFYTWKTVFRDLIVLLERSKVHEIKPEKTKLKNSHGGQCCGVA